MTALYWITALASIVAVLLNIHGRRSCFLIWAATNAIWTAADMAHGLPQQAALQAAYLGLSLYGIWRWSRRPRAATG